MSDSAGIPLVDYATLGRHYNPWYIGHVALARHSKWIHRGDHNARQGFLRLADWLASNAEPWHEGKAWIYRYDWFNGHRAPWISGISQALGISVLLRAAALSGDAKYSEVAQEAMAVMTAPLDQGGTAVEWSDGTFSFEESAKRPATTILNGHLFSVFALHDAARYFQCDRYADLRDRGFEFVRRRIGDYDLGYWSCYSLKRGRAGTPDVASVHYHGVHVAQFRAAAALVSDNRFARWADRFEGYQQLLGCRLKALWLKRLNKILDL